MKHKIAILCSGGDVSGMNPALKRFVEYAIARDMEPYFVYHGFEGLIDNKIVPATYRDVAGIITRGGTKIGSARSERFKQSAYRQQAADNLRAHGITMLIVLGMAVFGGWRRSTVNRGFRFAVSPRRSTTTSTAPITASGSTRPWGSSATP